MVITTISLQGQSRTGFEIHNFTKFKLDYTIGHFDKEIPPQASRVTEVALPPGAPLSLVCPASTYNTMHLTWDLGASDTVTGIIIERKMEGEALSLHLLIIKFSFSRRMVCRIGFIRSASHYPLPLMKK